MKTRREKLEELAVALSGLANSQMSMRLNEVCLALSESDAPEQTADDVWKMWETSRPAMARGYENGNCAEGALAEVKFANAYRAWKSKQNPAKVPVFEITDDLKRTLETVLYKHEIVPMDTLVNNVAAAIQAATAKDPT